MKISELIKELDEIRLFRGDIDVLFCGDEEEDKQINVVFECEFPEGKWTAYLQYQI